MLAQTEIERYGGKAAILNHIMDNTNLPIPRYVVKESGQSLDAILPEFNSMEKPVIVRSSSPYEYGNFEGIFESERDIEDQDGLECAIKSVESSATSERAVKYAEQNGFDVDGKMHTIIQEQSPSRYCGAMMRHPNNPDLIFVIYFEGRERFKQVYTASLFNERTQEETISRGFSSYGMEENVGFLVDQYKKIEALDDIADDKVLFVEFGLDPFAVYQARPFKKKELADFELPNHDEDSSLWSDFVFGITPPEGVVLPVVKGIDYDTILQGFSRVDEVLSGSEDFEGLDFELKSNLINTGIVVKHGAVSAENGAENLMRNWYSNAEHGFGGKHYCLVTGSAQRDPYDLDLMVPSMRGLVLGQTDVFLVHNLMRLFKQSDVTLGISPNLFHTDFYKDVNHYEGSIRLISNGKEGVAIKE